MRAEAARAAPRVVAVAWRVDRREEEEARQAGVRVVGVVGAEAAPVAAAPMAARLAALRIPQRIARSPSRGHPRGHDGSSAEPTRPLHATAARFRQARATGAADRTRAEWTRHSASSGSVEFVSPGRNELPTERHRVYKREYAMAEIFPRGTYASVYTQTHSTHTNTQHQQPRPCLYSWRVGFDGAGGVANANSTPLQHQQLSCARWCAAAPRLQANGR